ncbi:hypothetical protein GCM10010428_78560 [Actinosynnema pretiosum subsp. pretiosum]
MSALVRVPEECDRAARVQAWMRAVPSVTIGKPVSADTDTRCATAIACASLASSAGWSAAARVSATP